VVDRSSSSSPFSPVRALQHCCVVIPTSVTIVVFLVGGPSCRIIAYTQASLGGRPLLKYAVHTGRPQLCCHNCLLQCNSPTNRQHHSLFVNLVSCMATVGVRKGKDKLGGGGRPPCQSMWPTLTYSNSSIEALADALHYRLYSYCGAVHGPNHKQGIEPGVGQRGVLPLSGCCYRSSMLLSPFICCGRSQHLG
jgi:hypothetical protein